MQRELYPTFLQISPQGCIPTILHHPRQCHKNSTAVTAACEDDNNDDDVVDDAIILWDSLIAAEYVDAVFDKQQQPAPPNDDGTITSKLMPTNALDRARVQLWCHHCTRRIQPCFEQAISEPCLNVQNGDDDNGNGRRRFYWKQCWDECRTLAQAMSDKGPFFMGNRFTMVDVAFVPLWQRILWLGGSKYWEFVNIDEDTVFFRRLETWWRACAARPSVSVTLVCKPRLVAFYADSSDIKSSISELTDQC